MKSTRCMMALACSMIAASGSFASDPADVVVTATRDRAEARRVPANVTVITADDIAAAGYNNIVEALDNAGGVYFRTTSGNATQSEIGMRGFGENSHGRVLVLVDGEKMNRPDMAGVDWLQIPLSNIDRIEVMRGSSSAVYGDHAVAGVVSIITKKGSKEREAAVSVQGGSFGANAEQGSISGSRGRVLYSVNAGHNGTDGYRDRSGYEAWNAAANLGCDISDRLNASLDGSVSDLNYEMPNFLTKEQMAADRRQSTAPDDSARNRMLGASAGLDADFGTAGRAGVKVSFTRKDVRSDMAGWSSFTDLTVDTIGVAPRYSREWTGFLSANKLLAGLDYYLDKLSVDRFSDKERTAQTVTADIDKETLGFYVRDEMELGDVLLSVGGRTESADIGGSMPGTFDGETSHRNNAADVALVLLVGDTSKVFGKFSTVYRNPFVDEQVSYFGYGADQVYTDIEPEKGRNTELGADLALRDGLRASATLFLLNMEDEIAYNSATYRNENLDKTRHRGVEAGLTCTMVTNVTFDATYTLTEATFRAGDNRGNDIPLVPANMATIAGTVALPRDFSLRVDARYTDSTRLGGDYANTAEKLSAYMVADLMLRYGPRDGRGFEAFAAVENVFNEEYSSLAYWNQFTGEIGYYPSPTRSYRAGVSYKF